MSENKTDVRVVQHRACSYDATDDPDTNMPSAKVPKFSLVPENEHSKLKIYCAVHVLFINFILATKRDGHIANY